MARVKITLNIREAQLREVAGTAARSAARRAAEVSRQRARNNLRAAGRFHTGELDRTIEVRDITSTYLHPRFAVGSPVKQAGFNEFGTRAHGPVTAKALRFKPKGSRVYVFAKWVRGITPVRFMRRALQSLTVYDYLK